MNSVISPEGDPNSCAACGAAWSPEDSRLFEKDFVCPKCGSRQRTLNQEENLFFLKSLDVMSLIDSYLASREGESEMPPLIIDMRDVEFLTSSELGRLLTLHRKARAARRRIILRNLHPDIREVLEITKIDKLFGEPGLFSDEE